MERERDVRLATFTLELKRVWAALYEVAEMTGSVVGDKIMTFNWRQPPFRKMESHGVAAKKKIFVFFVKRIFMPL